MMRVAELHGLFHHHVLPRHMRGERQPEQQAEPSQDEQKDTQQPGAGQRVGLGREDLRHGAGQETVDGPWPDRRARAGDGGRGPIVNRIVTFGDPLLRRG